MEHVLRAAATTEPLLHLPLELRLQLARRKEEGLAAMEPEEGQLQQQPLPASAPSPLPDSPLSLPPGTVPGTTFQTPRCVSPLLPGDAAAAADGAAPAAPSGHSTPPAPTDLPRPSFAGPGDGGGGDRSPSTAQAAQQQQEPAAGLFPTELADEALERMQAPQLRRLLREALQTIAEQRQRLFRIGLLAGVQ